MRLFLCGLYLQTVLFGSDFREHIINATFEMSSLALCCKEVKVFVLDLSNDFLLGLRTNSFGPDFEFRGSLFLQEATLE